MGKRRDHQEWMWQNRSARKYDAPRVGYKSVHDTKPSRRNIWHYLQHPLVEPNSCKYLSSNCSRGSYYLNIRDRQEDQAYFWVYIKGSYIRAIKVQYIQNGEAINTFMAITIPNVCGQEVEVNEIETKIIELFRVPLSDYKEVPRLFKEATPSLNWWEEET